MHGEFPPGRRRKTAPLLEESASNRLCQPKQVGKAKDQSSDVEIGNIISSQNSFQQLRAFQVKPEFLPHGVEDFHGFSFCFTQIIRSNSSSEGESEGLKGPGILLTAFGERRFQAIAIPHGEVAFEKDLIGVVDDAFYNSLGNRAAGIRIWVNTGIPALGLVLGAKDHGALATSPTISVGHNLTKIYKIAPILALFSV